MTVQDHKRWSSTVFTKMSLIALIERPESTFHDVRTYFHFYPKELYIHLKKLEGYGLIEPIPEFRKLIESKEPIQLTEVNHQVIVYACTNISWDEAKELDEEESKAVAREWLEHNETAKLDEWLAPLSDYTN